MLAHQPLPAVGANALVSALVDEVRLLLDEAHDAQPLAGGRHVAARAAATGTRCRRKRCHGCASVKEAIRRRLDGEVIVAQQRAQGIVR